MMHIPYRPLFAGVLALLCAACGGSAADAHVLAALQADSAFSQPVTIRIPRSIRVTASASNSGGHQLGGIAQYGPKQFRELNAPMNVLREAGVLRVNDHSQRMLVRTQRLATTCVPYVYHPPHGSPSMSHCGRGAETRIYDYSHTVQVSPTTAPGAEWRQDAEPWEPVFDLPGARFSPGWVVELGRREIVDVGEVSNPEPGIRKVDYTWRWALTPTGGHFDPGGATQLALPSSVRTYAIAGMREAPRADSVYSGTALLLRVGDTWQAIEVRLR